MTRRTGISELNTSAAVGQDFEAGGNMRATRFLPGEGAATSKTTAGDVTLTAAELLTGCIVVDCAGGARTYTLPTAALLVAAMAVSDMGCKVGDILQVLIINGSDAAETITLAAGTGGAFVTEQTAASRVIPQNAQKIVRIRITSITSGAEAYVVCA